MSIIIGDLAEGQQPTSFLTAGSLLHDLNINVGGTVEVMSFDLSKKQYLVFELGKKVNVAGRTSSIGGGGGNAAYTMVMQGNKVATMGVIGKDIFGQSIIDFFIGCGIDCSRIATDPKKSTGLSILLTPETGNSPIATDRAASKNIKLINTNLDDSGYNWLYLSGLLGNFIVLKKLIESARRNGIKVFFNPSKAELLKPDELRKLLKYIDIVSINSDEAVLLVEGFDINQQVCNLKRLVKDVAIITDGKNGAYVATSNKVYHAPIYSKVKIVSTVGAGDAHNAGFLSAYANGKTVEEALICGAANATSVLKFADAKTGALKKGKKLHGLRVQVTDF